MIDPSRPVRVFRNWKRGCWSIMQDGALRASAREVLLADVALVVRESGRRRMLREQRKNVHAYAVGTLVDWVHADDPRVVAPLAGRELWYDPERCSSFVDREDLTPVLGAPAVHLHTAGAIYLPGALPAAA